MNLIPALQNKTRYISQFDTTYRLINSDRKCFYLITRKNKKTTVDIDYNIFNDIFGILHLQSKTHILRRSYNVIQVHDVYSNLTHFAIARQ
ncbi:hypothetical protein Paride_0258 [Pseudomonas phage Paride]|nr:hypothetical protein Paride_0258 [Pseudomonas phage Paride]